MVVEVEVLEQLELMAILVRKAMVEAVAMAFR